MSFSKDEYKFKASQIDRKLSYKNLEMAFVELRKKSTYSEQRHEQSNDDGGGVLSIFDMPTPSSGADQDDIDNAEMARNLQQKKKRGRRM
ncbi:MAG: hypothetical protein R3Y39_05210 [Rikenellaceae bacterium]